MEENERIIEQNEKEEEEEEEVLVQQQQEVWSWGAGTEGQLGTGKLQDEHNPQLLNSLSSFAGPIPFLSCGGAHVIALTPGGRVLTWGRGTSGQLGHGEMVNVLQPKPVESLEGFVITHVSAGWNHSGFVSDKGYLFTCGDGSFGQLGHGDCTSRFSPQKVSYFELRHVTQIACGMRHSVVLVKDHLGQQVHGFGFGKRGQLGISNERLQSVSLPQTSLGLNDVKIVSVYANGDHSAALCAEGQLYTWGRGFGGASDVHIPQCVTTCLSFSTAALGWNHALLLTGDGEAFMLGDYGHGVLSDPQMTISRKKESDKDAVWRIPGLNGLKVRQIAAGAEHSAVVTGKSSSRILFENDGSVLTWGWGEHGQLGLGDTADQTGPHVVSFDKLIAPQHLVGQVYCGSGFTYAIRTPGTNSNV
ncbi:unnamed protein product [Coffea canephora]|uniref:RCC1-like domain-containing protein n=1 Tax=Coffea canephora TaxID=49390 RepID=A0A068TW75_COFCA|nr:unnamed protein product [Coffea canephora]